MLLEIDDNKTVSDLQDKFNECFPGFGILFYNKQYHTGNAQTPINGNVHIGDIRKPHNPGVLDMKSWNKAGDITAHFKKQFGLHVQVFYMVNETWMPVEDKHAIRLE